MIFRMDQLLSSLSMGLDAVEGELLGATTNHGKRISILAIMMGRHLGWNDDDLIGVAGCALMHDNALTEYILSERPEGAHAMDHGAHCLIGEENVLYFPFPSDVRGFVKYHHEYMDKSGPFKMDAAKTPLGAQIIAAADDVDARYHLQRLSPAFLPDLRGFISSKRGGYYTCLAADALLAVLDEDLLFSLRDEQVDITFGQKMPKWVVDMPAVDLMNIAKVVASITDYKSQYTARHSLQIAYRAYWMGLYYGFPREQCAKIYLAASFHDIGKLLIPAAVLEKPGKLTEQEFAIIQKHAFWSYAMLKDIEGFEEICRWAVTHHRKLNGKGYPQLPQCYLDMDFTSRLIACIDIYQALRETRPYHRGRSHEETIRIMGWMASHGEIDSQITGDIDRVMVLFKDSEMPGPEEADAHFGLSSQSAGKLHYPGMAFRPAGS
ncbi:MAG: HD domain-containing phosphohydrolase [Clostridiales bacterium]